MARRAAAEFWSWPNRLRRIFGGLTFPSAMTEGGTAGGLNRAVKRKERAEP